MVYFKYWVRTGLLSGHWEIEAIDKTLEKVKEMLKEGNYIINNELIGSEASIIAYDDIVKFQSLEEAVNILNQYKDKEKEPMIINIKDIEEKIICNSKDPHTTLAKILFETENPTEEQRRLAKTINYGRMYSNQEGKNA